MNPPKAEKIKKELVAHHQVRIDNYYWLNERTNPKVIDYLKSENEYTDKVLESFKPFQEKIYNEIIGRIKQTDMSVPYRSDSYYYYSRYEEGQEYPVYCRKKGLLDAIEEIILNVNELAKGKSFCEIIGLSVSTDKNILAFGADYKGRRQYEIYFKNLTTGELYNDVIINTTGNVAWANDNKTIFYSIKDDSLRPYKILRHTLGSQQSGDTEVFHETDETYATYVYKSKSKRFIIIASDSTLSNEYRFLKAENPAGEFKIVHPREHELEYNIWDYNDKFYVRTNYLAKNFRLMETPIDKSAKENWKEIIAHREDVLLEGIEVFKEYIVIEERKDGLTQLRIINKKQNTDKYIDFGEASYMAYTGTNVEFDSNIFRYGYTSLTTPNSVYDYDMDSGSSVLMKQQEVVGGYNPAEYKTERLYATAKDGTKIPMSVVYKNGMKKDGTNPTVLYGYGSYGVTVDPTFSPARLSLLNRGFIFVIAHIRGGEDLGRQWYENGKMLKKKNTFTDFIACAEYLIAEKYTSNTKLFAMGGSAGGLLMGAVVNMRPDLFKGIVAMVPFVDVMTTMLDDTLPLTTGEYDEWGNPNSKEYYDYMLSYSPYDNLEAKNYPAMLVTTGLHDSQVQYWEPAKWVAKLRTLKQDNNPLLLHTNMEAGHGGASGRFQQYKETALNYIFIFSQLGIKN